MEPFNSENKKNVAAAIALLINDAHSIPLYLQERLVDSLLWAATEVNNDGKWTKYFGPNYWSRGAIETVVNNINLKNKTDKDLRHEHSVPKCLIADELDRMYANNCISVDDIHSLLEKFAHAVIVSIPEDNKLNKAGLRSKMPGTFSFDGSGDLLSRYKSVGIEIYKLHPKQLELLSKGIIPDGGIFSLMTNKIC